MGLVAVKSVHTIAFFGIGSCLVYLAYSGLTGRSDRRAAIAGVVVIAESVIYAANGFRCPLTTLAERLGSDHASVADIYLPRWVVAHLPLISGPIFAGALVLHARNMMWARARDLPEVLVTPNHHQPDSERAARRWPRSAGTRCPGPGVGRDHALARRLPA